MPPKKPVLTKEQQADIQELIEREMRNTWQMLAGTDVTMRESDLARVIGDRANRGANGIFEVVATGNVRK